MAKVTRVRPEPPSESPGSPHERILQPYTLCSFDLRKGQSQECHGGQQGLSLTSQLPRGMQREDPSSWESGAAGS